jgi:ribosomal protein S7
MADAAAGAHALSVAWTNDRTRAQAVLVLKRAVQNVGNDFHVAVRMGGEAFAGPDPVFVDHAQGTKSHETWIVILVERKRVARIEPAEIAPTAFIAASNLDHNKILVTTTISISV